MAQWLHLQREWETSVQPLKNADNAYSISAQPKANIVKSMQTGIYWKKYLNGYENLKGHKK
jgi:hypothetical protein